jgi:signal transduction histidine kinase
LFALLPEDSIPSAGEIGQFMENATPAQQEPTAQPPPQGDAQMSQQVRRQGQQALGQEGQAQVAQMADSPDGQLWRNTAEWQARNDNIQRAVTNNSQVQGFSLRSPGIREGIMSPLWIGGELLLARRASIRGQDCIQGCWLDWPGLEKKLLARIQDILPDADLVPARTGAEENGSRRLAALPVILVPGELPSAEATPASPGGSPERLSLLAAWACLALAAVAVAALLAGIVALSERRGAFVSAVTHELRTPLTTFRMYTEMLQGGMVAGEEKKGQYLATLSTEAQRLSHLVENVLAYARLERGRFTARSETVSLADVLERVKGRLEDRARAAGMRLEVQAPDEVLSATVKVDVSAVEQILFNLVDNACKYASGADDKRICISAARRGSECDLQVSDRGPGISPAEAKRLFQPFSKSARQAAHSAPGVGLGLALSRRLARQMGGDLRLDPGADGGAGFVLSLKG